MEAKIGNHIFFIPAFIGMSKKRFLEIYKGKVTIDLDNAWYVIQKEIKEYESSANIGKKYNKAKAGGVDETAFSE